MARRPSLATAKIKKDSAATTAALKELSSETIQPGETQSNISMQKPYHAATREGLKKVTVGLLPRERIALKILAARREMTSEQLMREAIADLLEKYNSRPE